MGMNSPPGDNQALSLDNWDKIAFVYREETHMTGEASVWIYELDNKGPSLWKRLQQIRLFGYDPLPSFGFALSISLIMIASYFLFNNDHIPNLDINKFTNDSKTFNPSTTISPQQTSIMADSDSTERKNVKNRYDDKIKLVRGK